MNMKIPIETLTTDTLTAIIEHYVLREGTDYGENIYNLEQKVAHVRAQLESDKAVLVFSESTESIDIISHHAYEKLLV